MSATKEPTPSQPPLTWGTISADEMSRVTDVTTRNTIQLGGKLRCDVIAHFRARLEDLGHEILCSETVYTCSDIRHAQRAAVLFRNACDVLKKLTAPPPAEPSPQPHRRTA